MRDLMFRGKTVRDGEWVISDSIIQHASGRVYLYDEVKDIDIEVDPETVGQFTGLTDKNGVNIFEGDIIEAVNGDVCTVKFVKGCWVIECRDDWDFFATNAGKSRVIGNIYDNEDLL